MTKSEPHAEVIVVGVDGSVGSLRAIRWAIGEAQLRGSSVEAVTAWQPRSANSIDSEAAAEDAQRLVLREVLTGWNSRPLVSEKIQMGELATVLVRRSEHASLLVIGRHGVGSAQHSGLGSTSDYCTRMAACPVVVIPVPAEHLLRADLEGVSC